MLKNNSNYLKNILSLFSILIFPFSISAQSHISTQSHAGKVTNVAYLEDSDGSVFSAGTDGFLVKWTEDGMGEHYQISDLTIKMIARSPNGNEIAVYESDGASLNRVSVWNWKTFTRKYAFRFTDSLTSLAYSAKGTYIICGTASVSGAFFLNSMNGSIIRNKIKGNTGVVNFIQTSDSEKSAVMYSPKGNLIYYNLQNGEQKAKFNTEYDLSQFCLFNNGVFGAGVRGSGIFVVQAVTGSTVGSFTAQNPILIGSNKSKDLYYIVNDNRQFKVYKIANDRNKAVIAPELMRTFSGLKTGEQIVCATLAGEEIYAGTNSGNIYKFDYAQAERVDVQQALTDKMYEKIYDIASVGNDFYFLTPSSIFQSSYESSNIDKKAANSGYTNIIPYGQNIILWSKDSKKAVVLLELASGKMTQLFAPEGTIQTLKLYGNSLIDVESNSQVNLFDIQNLKKRELYKGTSIQDAILFTENDLYVAKSSGSSPNVPLIYVNVNTQETVPLSMKGNVAYSLTYDYDKNPAEIYGITIYTNAQTKKLTTSIFAYKPQTKSSRYLLSITDEDSEAFANLFDNILYTNIGKSQVRSYNLSTRRDFQYRRSASMPIKTVRNQDKMVVLNRDGSISWYNPTLNSVLADWYLTTEGSWFEF
ncbi:hypothetical protein DYE50_05030 [Treponema ruminis]|uniref:WD40 repeat protein n=1 Tax=Treponema ruminis TaxID=744515 RepID=A0A7W8G7E5_9SPIR|nr:hypothetical protein [Treponema ruminis]MBB5225191.1 WD40 repeat protein [Treponema ruminis]QSI01939.1 hypothetical protein DYE50_05030 [Treponema ruminis]